MKVNIENVVRKKLKLAADSNSESSVINIVSATNEQKDDILLDEIDYDLVRDLHGYEAPHNLTLVCDMYDKTSYQPLEFIEITRKPQTTMLQAEVNFQPSQWQQTTNLLSFIKIIRDNMLMESGISSDLEELYDEDLLHIKFYLEEYIGSSIETIVGDFVDKVSGVHKRAMNDMAAEAMLSHTQISREIFLPKESVCASVSLLYFLTTLLSRRFGDKLVSSTIEQKKESVLLEINLVAESKKEILHAISDYAEVLSGMQKAEDFFAAPVSLAMYKHKLNTLKEEITFSYKDSFEVIPRSAGSMHLVDTDLVKLKRVVGQGLLSNSALTIENNKDGLFSIKSLQLSSI